MICDMHAAMHCFVDASGISFWLLWMLYLLYWVIKNGIQWRIVCRTHFIIITVNDIKMHLHMNVFFSHITRNDETETMKAYFIKKLVKIYRKLTRFIFQDSKRNSQFLFCPPYSPIVIVFSACISSSSSIKKLLILLIYWSVIHIFIPKRNILIENIYI